VIRAIHSVSFVTSIVAAMASPPPARMSAATKARFRARAYGWRGSALASKRLKEAVREINAVAKSDRVLAAEGKVFDVIEAEPHRLREVTDIGPMRA
jgi:hypothetical protein